MVRFEVNAAITLETPPKPWLMMLVANLRIYASVRMATARTRVAAARNCAVSDPEGPPKALQASECDELLDHTRASYMILAQRQPGKFIL